MINQQLIKVFGSDGTLITSQVMIDGTCTLDLPGQYVGAILIELIDSNATDVDYVDEHTGLQLSLTNSLRAFVTVTADANTLNVSVTPVTEMAVKLAIANGAVLPSTPSALLNIAVVNDSNQEVSLALLNGKSVLEPFVTVINTGGTQNSQYNETDGLSDAELYGQLLVKLSGNDAITGSTQATITQYVEVILGNNASTQNVVSQMLLQGAKTFEQGTKAALAELPVPVANQRILHAPVLMNQLKADEETGASIRSNASVNALANAQKELADGNVLLNGLSTALILPVALAFMMHVCMTMLGLLLKY